MNLKRIIILTILFKLSIIAVLSQAAINEPIDQKIWKKCRRKTTYGPKKTYRKLNSSEKLLCKKYRLLKSERNRIASITKRKKELMYDMEMDLDATSLGHTSLLKFNICKKKYTPTVILNNGKRIKMLGMAFVYMPGSYNSSIVGHVAERYIYCKDDKIQDLLFEYTQITHNEIEMIRRKFKAPKTHEANEYLRELDGKILLFTVKNPTNKNKAGYGYYQVENNRDIIEMWPKINEKKIYQGLEENINEYKDQMKRFKNRTYFKEYDLFSYNCTHPLRKRLNSYGGNFSISNWQGFTPKLIFNFLKTKKIEKMIIYPSQRLLRKFQMLDQKKSLWLEHITFLTKTSSNERNDFLFLYPEFRGIKKLLLNPIYSTLNFISGLVETIYGVITMPLELISDISGLEFFMGESRHFKSGLKGMAFSLAEFTGLRLRYPQATIWNEEELEFIRKELPKQIPKIIPYLKSKLDVIP